uniref:MARVEL domain-containing protein n=1 Tax=Panagrolaimus sp. PS1159 TaxID=55785 RepID=A0AC35FLW3_9BILA
MAEFILGYLSSNRGIIKIFQIIIGIILCSFLCAYQYGVRSCFGEGRVGFTSGLNVIVLIANIVFLVLGLLTLNVTKLDHIYSVVCAVLFAIAAALFLWYMIQYDTFVYNHVLVAVLIFVQFLLFLWDVKILTGRAPN